MYIFLGFDFVVAELGCVFFLVMQLGVPGIGISWWKLRNQLR